MADVFDEAYLSARIAHCFRDLGQGRQATRYARRSLNMNRDFVRGRAFNLPLLATALTQEGNIDEAIAVGRTATELAMGLQSQRSVRYIVDLHRRLERVAPRPMLEEFSQQAAALARARTERQ